MKLRREPRVALVMCGDGATSKGDFYEAMNAAGVWQLPLVIVAVNNQYAISVPRHMQTKAQTIAQKAIAAGVDCEQCDGNDLIAVRDTVGRAVEKARTGGGPTLVEAVTYRLSDHTTADDATRYRSAEEVKEQWKAEPILRLRTWLHAKGAWSPAEGCGHACAEDGAGLCGNAAARTRADVRAPVRKIAAAVHRPGHPTNRSGK